MAIPTYTREQLITLISTKLAGSPNTIDAVEHRELETAIVNAIYGQIGDIKEIAVNDAYIIANFQTGTSNPQEGLGLVNGERYGWAICNGKNGTVDKRGNVSVGYDPLNGYPLAQLNTGGGPTPYKQGGEKNVTLQESQMPPHNHGYTGRNGRGFPDASGDTVPSNWVEGDGNWYRTYVRDTKIENKGGGLAHENMQPYIVTLFIQRIPV